MYKEKGSRFICYLYPVKDEEEIRLLLVRVKKEHHSARHHCYAWRLGTETLSSRSSDDGEPSGTAGKPILGQITANDLTNVLIVVVRYFGGILLGTGGLVQAYRSAAADAIEKSELIAIEPEYSLEVICRYEHLNQVYQIIHALGIRVMESYLEGQCRLVIAAGKTSIEPAAQQMEKIYGVKTGIPVLING
ncbi:MAG TPA: YigZ family protein [Prolixibacteraceae bacterium]|nr:YigZ family protein [Prolixibacteraceae bacterium]